MDTLLKKFADDNTKIEILTEISNYIENSSDKELTKTYGTILFFIQYLLERKIDQKEMKRILTKLLSNKQNYIEPLQTFFKKDPKPEMKNEDFTEEMKNAGLILDGRYLRQNRSKRIQKKRSKSRNLSLVNSKKKRSQVRRKRSRSKKRRSPK